MPFVKYEPKGDIAYLVIDRPEALNALNAQVLADLDAALDNIDLELIRCVILRGAGEKSFVAGADIAQMKDLNQAGGEAFGKQGNDVFLKLESFPIPVIAAVGGYALGGGCELAMACDFRICSDTAVFGQPEVGLGITPGFGGTQRLARIVGPGMAKQMIYTARNIKADEALRIGLVNAVYPAAELYAAAEKLASTIAANAPIAVRACKKAINEGAALPIEQAVVCEEKAFGSCFETGDQQEGMGAFLEKRKHAPFTNH
ncbi:MAG: enoyl-CoA hydratase/isomerase family protein [Oscillospiraceae bacterium]|nr:enoyl-CoA hydratase/isomerase family protein [Oscillospiraceae bacterium]